MGASAYSEHPSTDIICACWKYQGSDRVREWLPEWGLTVHLEELFDALDAGELIEAHGAPFEICIWMNVAAKKYNWPLVPLEQWRCSMAVACYQAMPRALDKLSEALGLGKMKDPRGKQLISQWSRRNLPTTQKRWENHDGVMPQIIKQEWLEYCAQDVRTEERVSNILGDLPDRELPNFHHQMVVNLRGIPIDIPAVSAAKDLVDQRAASLTAQFTEITGLAPTQTVKAKNWFNANGCELENMQADYIKEQFDAGAIPDGRSRDAMEIRLKIAKASTKKLGAMLRQSGADGRARFQVQYHGAVTGRTTGSGIQPLNFNRGFASWDPPPTPETLVRDISYGNAQYLDGVYGDATDAVAKATRHWVQAAPGHRFMAGDYVSIEAVLLACLAGEQWKVEAFREGVKIYEHMADKIYGLPPGTVTKKTHPLERQDGKTGELAFGYRGALGAWRNFDSSERHTDDRVLEICRAWRSEHPATTLLWDDMEDAAVAAIQCPGQRFNVPQAHVGFEMQDEWLNMILPNGKRLWYFRAEMGYAWPAWHRQGQAEGGDHECALGLCNCKMTNQIFYWATKEQKWAQRSTYSGKLVENLVQATSRELLLLAARMAEDAGYPVFLTVYDEIACEVPEGYGSIEELTKIMSMVDTRPDWAEGWPINVDVWEGDRYKK